jgi:hypothetical protein
MRWRLRMIAGEIGLFSSFFQLDRSADARSISSFVSADEHVLLNVSNGR